MTNKYVFTSWNLVQSEDGISPMIGTIWNLIHLMRLLEEAFLLEDLQIHHFQYAVGFSPIMNGCLGD